MSERKPHWTSIASLVVAFVAVIGLTGTAVHYVAAQTGEVKLQGARLESVAAQAGQIPFIWEEVQEQGEEIHLIRESMVTKEQLEKFQMQLLEKIRSTIQSELEKTP